MAMAVGIFFLRYLSQTIARKYEMKDWAGQCWSVCFFCVVVVQKVGAEVAEIGANSQFYAIAS